MKGRMVMFFAVAALFLFGIALSGCGILGFCSNTCPEGWVHGSVDCGCMEVAKKKANGGDPQKPYYATRRYVCSDNSDCTVTVYETSCAAALQGIRDQLSQVKDPCQYCSGVTDLNRHWTQQAEYIQDGPCYGLSQKSVFFRFAKQEGEKAPTNYSPRSLGIIVAASSD